MGDLERQEAVEAAAGGCLLAVMGLAVVAVVCAILGALLMLNGAGPAVVHWAAR